MVNKRVGSSTAPSDWALRQLPARVTTFLYAVGTHTPIRAALAEGGYRQSDHAEGFAPLLEMLRWYEDWSLTARTFISRKDWLIRLGLIQRRRRRGAD